jgi:hypothetical protein
MNVYSQASGIFHYDQPHLTMLEPARDSFTTLGQKGKGGIALGSKSGTEFGGGGKLARVDGLTCLSVRCLSSYLFFRQFQ